MDRLRGNKRSAASSGQSQSEKPPRKHLCSFTTPTVITVPGETFEIEKDEFIVSLPAISLLKKPWRVASDRQLRNFSS